MCLNSYVLKNELVNEHLSSVKVRERKARFPPTDPREMVAREELIPSVKEKVRPQKMSMEKNAQ